MKSRGSVYLRELPKADSVNLPHVAPYDNQLTRGLTNMTVSERRISVRGVDPNEARSRTGKWMVKSRCSLLTKQQYPAFKINTFLWHRCAPETTGTGGRL